MSIKVLIADDEQVAVKRLELALSCIPEVELVGVARTGKEALDLIRELGPDVAILDIQMPAKDGFGVLAGLRPTDKTPEVIFVTAYDNHAVRAFEVRAIDYLLKPVPFDRLRGAVRDAHRRLQSRAADERFAELQATIEQLSGDRSDLPRFDREIWVKERDGLTRLSVDGVDLFEAAGDYVIAHAGESSHFLATSLNALQERLDPDAMMRVHRSAIVNRSRVRTIRRRGMRGLAVLLQSGKQVSVGPSYADAVLRAFNLRRWR